MNKPVIKGFSKLDRSGRIQVLSKHMDENIAPILDDFLHKNPELQEVFGEFSENYLSNYFLPFGLVPNVLVNGKNYLVPAVIEESSVVAAASRAAGFWAENGGFKSTVTGTIRKGQVHFLWHGEEAVLRSLFPTIKEQIFKDTRELTQRMRQRGGGITSLELQSLTDLLTNYYQVDVGFETVDAMGANFINTCLETIAETLRKTIDAAYPGKLEVVMAILSNHTPESRVACTVTCPVEQLAPMAKNLTPRDFARKFILAVTMANVNVSRAVTHNKGIYNGIDAVVLATGNDWRAIEAAGHADAAKTGSYAGIGSAKLEGDVFSYTISVPMALGTVGGVTASHPLARFGMHMLGNPGAKELMQIIVAVGMANNFSAIASLITSGIQKGHMKMHLSNILNQLGAGKNQKDAALAYFRERSVSYAAVAEFLESHT